MIAAMPPAETLLVNYWYAHPVGHAVEGMRYALGYKAANPELRVSLLLNGASAVELARLCPFIDQVYAVPFTRFNDLDCDPRKAVAAVPRSWDWVVENHRVHEQSHAEIRGFQAFFAVAHEHLLPRHPLGVTGKAPPAYLPHQQLRLELPVGVRRAAAKRLRGAKAIAVVLAGSSSARRLYPSTASWEMILGALSARFPDVRLLVVGKHTADGRTTSQVGRDELVRLLAAIPAAVDCFDLPLLEQVALIEAAELLVSPHTGLAFVASAVGTPWLAISGGNWHEYFFNGVPVYSMVPDPDRYPTFTWGAPGAEVERDEDGEGPRSASMCAARIREDLPELLRAADQLIRHELSYEDALAEYFPRLLAAYRGDRSRSFSFDNIGDLYLPPRRPV